MNYYAYYRTAEGQSSLIRDMQAYQKKLDAGSRQAESNSDCCLIEKIKSMFTFCCCAKEANSKQSVESMRIIRNLRDKASVIRR